MSDTQRLDHRDRESFDALVAARPAWTGMKRAADAVGLPSMTILHCGPPVRSAGELVQPTCNSAAVACVFEGWAPDLVAGLALVRSGDVEFRPAQDARVATPMAAVVSPSMPLIEMTDLAAPGHVAYAPINGGGNGGDPAPRYGRCSEAALSFLRFLNGEVADALSAATGEPLEWLPIIDAALLEGDDGHLRHGAAHARLVALVRERAGPGALGADADAFMGQWPFFHLNFWMAAIRCAMESASGFEGSALITAFGGNGAEFGLQVSGLPGRWFQVPATPPLGRVREPHGADSGVGAYGDSALVEAFGLGALAHRYSPDMQALHADFYHDDLLDLPAKLLAGPHPALRRSGARAGLSVRRIVETGTTPVVELGIVEKTGEFGGLGAGLYRPPLALFEAAASALDGAA